MKTTKPKIVTEAFGKYVEIDDTMCAVLPPVELTDGKKMIWRKTKKFKVYLHEEEIKELYEFIKGGE